ncbi:tetratricopeptide repeat protein [Fibrobacterota bacterium]
MVILPFNNQTGRDALWFSYALEEAMRIRLGGIEAVRLLSFKDMVKAGPAENSGLFSEETALKIGYGLKAGHVCTGNYAVKGEQVEITASLINMGSVYPDSYQADSLKEGEAFSGVGDGAVPVQTTGLSASLKLSGTKDHFFQLQEQIIAGLLARTEEFEGRSEDNIQSPGIGDPPVGLEQDVKLGAFDYLERGLRSHFINPDSALSYYQSALKVNANYYLAVYFSGLIHLRLGRFDKAVEQFYRAERVLIADGMKNSLQYADVISRIADVYKNKKEDHKALEHFLRSRDLYVSLDLQNTASFGEVLNEIGDVYYKHNRSRDAIEYYAKARSILQALSFWGSPAYAEALHSAGDIYFQKGLMNEARDNYTVSRDVSDRLGFQGSYTYAGLMNNIGNTYMGIDQLKEAETYFIGSRQFLENQALKKTEGYAVLASSLGVIHRRRGEWQQALDYFSQSRAIYQELKMEQTEAYAQLMWNLGVGFHDKWNLDKAMEHYLLSLNIRKSLGRENSPGYAQVLHGIGMIYQARGKPEKTLKYYNMSKELLDSLGMGQTSLYADLLRSLGYMYYANYQPVEALEYYQKASKIKRALKLEQTLDYAVLMQDIGDVYLKHHGKPCKVVPYEKKAMKIKEDLGYSELTVDRKYLIRMERECKEGSPSLLEQGFPRPAPRLERKNFITIN